MGFRVTCALLGLLCSLAVVHSAPLQISNGNNRSVDEPVEELESLKQAETKPVQISLSSARTSVFSDVNGHRQGHSETQKQLNKNGEVVARVGQKTELAQEPESQARGQTRTELELPAEGIHRTAQREEEPDSALEKMNAISGIEYSPLDMAEYVFWTGDEKGVTLAIEDFLQEGLLTREEAINFLQSIKSNLDYIQAHYQGLRKMEEKIAGKLQQQMNIEENSNDYEKKLRETFLEAANVNSKQEKSREEGMEEKRKRADGDDYDELLDRLKGADQLYNDYSLEEVIYQLAKLMFSQSLAQGSSQAHQALRRFTEYLEKEVEFGQISRQLEKKILAVLVAALADTLGERPELLAAASEGLSNIVVPDIKNHVIERRSQRISSLSAQEPRSHVLQRRSQPNSIPVQKIKSFGEISAQELRKHAAVRRSTGISTLALPGARHSG